MARVAVSPTLSESRLAMDSEPIWGGASRDAGRTTTRALSRRAPAMAMICARPGARAWSAPVEESTETTAVSVEIQEILSGPSSLPLASRDSATTLVELPTVIGRAGRWLMVRETGEVVSAAGGPSGFAPDAAA